MFNKLVPEPYAFANTHLENKGEELLFTQIIPLVFNIVNSHFVKLGVVAATL